MEFTTLNDSHRVFRGINISSFFFLTSLQSWLWRWNWWMGNDRHSFHLPANIWWQSSSTQQRKRTAARGLVDRGEWESTQWERYGWIAAPRWCRPTPRNSHVSLFPYRWQKYLVSHRWRMYHKWYSCGAYCRQPGEIIHFDHYVSFDSYEAAWVDLSKYQRFGLSKLRNYFELRDIHEIRMVYNELFTRKKIY